jgi:ATP-dependent RNA helicase DOB1
VSFLHKQPCHVVYTDYRPTPLQHYIYPSGGDGIHLVVDENGAFREDNFNKAMLALKDISSNEQFKMNDMKRNTSHNVRTANANGSSGGESSCYKIVKMIMEREMAPVIVFSFSKKECEAYAVLASKLDLNTGILANF